jgi:hypothetical protein
MKKCNLLFSHIYILFQGRDLPGSESFTYPSPIKNVLEKKTVLGESQLRQMRASKTLFYQYFWTRFQGVYRQAKGEITVGNCDRGLDCFDLSCNKLCSFGRQQSRVGQGVVIQNRGLKFKSRRGVYF